MSIDVSTDGVGIATITMDDGKANAFDVPRFRRLDEAFDECADARAVVLAGRPGMFSAGLNTKLLADISDDGLAELLTVFGQVVLRIWLEPRPVVAAATGHAIAGGTILAMAADHAVAAAGEYGWGLTETTIGFPMPMWVIRLARGNVRTDRLDDLILPGALIRPEAAVEAGFADVVAPAEDVVETATARARELAELPIQAYAETKRRLRQAAADTALAEIDDEVRALVSAR